MVTLIFPVVPLPTIAVILVGEFTTKDAADVPPKLTEVAPFKLIPVIDTVTPVAAEVGVNDVITGNGTNVNPARLSVPYGVTTFTFPVAPVPKTAFIVLGEITVNVFAATPPKLTAVAPERLFPEIVTVWPCPVEVGLNEVITGGPAKTNPVALSLPY